MPTGWPLEARLHLIHELYLAVGENPKVKEYTNPQTDTFWLTRAIIQDTIFATTNKTKLIQVLKKSPIWEKISQFLDNSDKSCGTPKCSGRKDDHISGQCTNKWCSPVRYSWNRPKDYKCPCKEFKPKKL